MSTIKITGKNAVRMPEEPPVPAPGPAPDPAFTPAGNRSCYGGTCFAVIRFKGGDPFVAASDSKECLEDIKGVYLVRIDAQRHTLLILYNGDLRTIHRLCNRLCEAGLEVVDYKTDQPLQEHSDFDNSQPGNPS